MPGCIQSRIDAVASHAGAAEERELVACSASEVGVARLRDDAETGDLVPSEDRGIVGCTEIEAVGEHHDAGITDAQRRTTGNARVGGSGNAGNCIECAGEYHHGTVRLADAKETATDRGISDAGAIGIHQDAFIGVHTVVVHYRARAGRGEHQTRDARHRISLAQQHGEDTVLCGECC